MFFVRGNVSVCCFFILLCQIHLKVDGKVLLQGLLKGLLHVYVLQFMETLHYHHNIFQSMYYYGYPSYVTVFMHLHHLL